MTSIDWKRRLAWVEPAAGAGKSRWLGGARSLHFDLCRAIQRCASDGQVPGILSKRAVAKLTEVVDEFSFLEGRTQAFVSDGNGVRWWTFAGGKANAALAITIERHGVRALRFDDFGLDIDALPPAILIEKMVSLPDEQPSAAIRREADELKFSACLPATLACSVVLQRQFDWLYSQNVLTLMPPMAAARQYRGVGSGLRPMRWDHLR